MKAIKQHMVPRGVVARKAKGLLLVLLLLCPIHSPAQQWRFWLNEKRPAQREMLKHAQSILLLNNSVVQPLTFGHNVVVDGNTLGQETVALDPAALHCLFAASQTLELSGEMLRVELLEHSQNPSDNFYARQTLSDRQMLELSNTYEVDALLILNQLVLYNIQESFPTDDGMHYAYLQAYAQSHWTVYSQGKSQSFSCTDTLLWESEPMYTRARAIDQLPTTQEALLYLARDLGDSIARSLTPQWVEVARYLYDNKQLQAGVEAFRYQRWEEAIGHWETAMGSKDKKTAAMAAANIAIAYEMLGERASACDFCQHAIRLFGACKTTYARQQQVNIRYYLAQLQARQARERDL